MYCDIKLSLVPELTSTIQCFMPGVLQMLRQIVINLTAAVQLHPVMSTERLVTSISLQFFQIA